MIPHRMWYVSFLVLQPSGWVATLTPYQVCSDVFLCICFRWHVWTYSLVVFKLSTRVTCIDAVYLLCERLSYGL